LDNGVCNNGVFAPESPSIKDSSASFRHVAPIRRINFYSQDFIASRIRGSLFLSFYLYLSLSI